MNGLRYKVVRFKSLKIALNELEPFIRNGAHLQSGRAFKKFGEMRSREALCNWLACAAINSWAGMERLTFTSDPVGGDGVIVDRINGESWPTEHVMVPRHRQGTSIDALIREAVRKKRSKGGQAYALGKTLVVFLDVIGGPWFPTKVAAGLPKPLWFDAVWVMGLQSADDGYVYNVTRLDNRMGQSPVWRIHIHSKFDGWTVEAIQ